MTDILTIINSSLWVVGTMIGWYASLGLLVWVAVWGIRFRWWTTEPGVNLWLFSALLTLLIVTNTIGNLGSATRGWYEMPPNIFPWWFALRYLVNTALAIVITRMDLLVFRRWRAGTNFTIDLPAREPKVKP